MVFMCFRVLRLGLGFSARVRVRVLQLGRM